MAKVYALIDPRTDGPFYVGYTAARYTSRLVSHSDLHVNNLMGVRLRELADLGLKPTMVRLETVEKGDPRKREKAWTQRLEGEGWLLLNLKVPGRWGAYRDERNRQAREGRLGEWLNSGEAFEWLAQHKEKTMAKKVHIGLLLDESGSMAHNRASVIQSVNEFVDELQDEADDQEMLATLATFDSGSNRDIVRFKFEGIPFGECREITDEDYAPHGSTPLNDAVIKTIKRMEKGARKRDKVMLVIMTDGYENASEADTKEVRKLIERKEKDGWAFIYLGANQDAWAEGGARGVAQASSYSFTASPTGTASTVKTTSNAVKLYTSAPKSTYDVAMASMNSATRGTIAEDTALDPAQFANQQADTTSTIDPETLSKVQNYLLSDKGETTGP